MTQRKNDVAAGTTAERVGDTAGGGSAAFAALEARVARTEAQLGRAQRRLQVTWGLTLVGVLTAVTLGSDPAARAQFGVTLSSLDARLKDVETKTSSMTAIADAITGLPTVRFSGVNLQVVNGSGVTQSTNGTGNLIIGYDERIGFTDGRRDGSHNLVLGNDQSYSSYGGVVFGRSNGVSAPFASVLGGRANAATGVAAVVAAGERNVASGVSASVAGGDTNRASQEAATVAGGAQNTASEYGAAVSGGDQNTADGQVATVGGGNLASTSTFAGWTAGINGANVTNYEGNFTSP